MLKDYQKTICKLFGITILDNKKAMFVSTPENIITIFEENQKLINDLEAKEFKIISEYKKLVAYDSQTTELNRFIYPHIYALDEQLKKHKAILNINFRKTAKL